MGNESSTATRKPRGIRHLPIHVHVVARKVERDKELKDECEIWVCRREIAEKT